MKVIFGAGNTMYDGWLSTQENELNLLKYEDFEKFFSQNSVAAMLAEHVWEHISLDNGIKAAKFCYEFLEPGGYIRVAVPDKNFRNEWYQNKIKIGGNGDPNHPSCSHKTVYDYKTLKSVFEQAGFEVDILEYCDENGCFHYKYWNESDGKINRSLRFDSRNTLDSLGMVSIIIDAKKPLLINCE